MVRIKATLIEHDSALLLASFLLFFLSISSARGEHLGPSEQLEDVPAYGVT